MNTILKHGLAAAAALLALSSVAQEVTLKVHHF